MASGSYGSSTPRARRGRSAGVATTRDLKQIRRCSSSARGGSARRGGRARRPAAVHVRRARRATLSGVPSTPPARARSRGAAGAVERSVARGSALFRGVQWLGLRRRQRRQSRCLVGAGGGEACCGSRFHCRMHVEYLRQARDFQRSCSHPVVRNHERQVLAAGPLPVVGLEKDRQAG